MKQPTESQLHRRRKINRVIFIFFRFSIAVLILIIWAASSTDDKYKGIEATPQEEARIDSVLAAQATRGKKEADAAFKKTKAGKIQAKHSDWTKEDCEKLARKEIWIGMSIDQVVYLRGRPNSRNDSNYGTGNKYQYGWDGYNPQFFYCGEDAIVTAYN